MPRRPMPLHTHTHTYTHDYFDSLFFLTKKPEWNSWTTLFGRNDGCWSLVRWPYMHLRHWRCCGRRRRWAPPTPPSYILPGLGIGWWSGQRLTAGYGGHSIHTSEGGVDVDESVSLSSLCVCVCVFIKKKKQKKLLYKDFMADFICVHFCPRRCRKAVKCINRVWMTSDFKILTKKKRRAWELNIRALLCYHFPKLLIKAWRQD